MRALVGAAGLAAALLATSGHAPSVVGGPQVAAAAHERIGVSSLSWTPLQVTTVTATPILVLTTPTAEGAASPGASAPPRSGTPRATAGSAATPVIVGPEEASPGATGATARPGAGATATGGGLSTGAATVAPQREITDPVPPTTISTSVGYRRQAAPWIPPVDDGVVNEMWARYGSPNRGLSMVERLGQGRPGPLSSWQVYAALTVLFAAAWAAVWRRLESTAGDDADELPRPGNGPRP